MIFILHVRHQRCARCGTTESLSNLYQAEELPAPGKAHKLLPCSTIGPLDPVHRVDLPERATPFCAACPAPESFAAGSEAYARWQETLRRKSVERQTQAAAALRPTKVQNLEDLA